MAKPQEVSIFLKEDTLVTDVHKVLKVIRPQWNLENVRSKVFSGGIMNKLVGYYLDGMFDEDVVVVKMYGNNTETMIDRRAEIETMKLLHKNKCGPELYGIFQNGICYEFIPGVTLSMETVRSPKVYPIVAAEMGKLHSISNANKKSEMWDKLRKFNDLVEDIFKTSPDLVKRLTNSRSELSLGFGTKAINKMEEILEAEGMPITFCHNDLLLGNIIYNEKVSKVSFIDFEYAMPNYAAYDVANHFAEFAGLENADFSKYPDKKFRLKWIAEYLKNLKLEGIEVSQERFEKWVELCLPVSHLFWALWSIVQAQNSTIDFDYIGYFRLRYDKYEKSIKQ